MEEISSNGHDKDIDLKDDDADEDDGDAEWLPAPKKPKTPVMPAKILSTPCFTQTKPPEKSLPVVKIKRPATVTKERRHSSEKLHLKKPVCASSENLMPSKLSSKLLF